MRNFKALALVLAAACLPLGGASAHHSFAMFDTKKEVWLEGTIKEFQWTNPHTFIQLEVPGRSGKTEWSLEGGSPNILSRNGWNRTVLRPGEKVRILLHPLRDGRPGGTFLEVHKDDGKVFYYHG